MQISNEELSEIKGGFGIVGVLAVLGISIFLSGILHGYTNPTYCRTKN